MSTPSLGIAHIAAAQTQKEVTANAALDALDSAANGQAAIAIADANTTLTAAQVASGGVLVITGALTAGRNLVVPATARRFVVKNNTTGGFSLTVKTPSGTGIAVAAGDGYKDLFCDGTNVVAIA
jgi:hypothetical protein